MIDAFPGHLPPRQVTRATLYALLGILAIALLLRVEAFLGTPVVAPLRADALQYYAAAHNLRTYGVYSTDPATLMGVETDAPAPDAARSPGYPLFLTALIGATPTQAGLDRVLLAQALLGTLAVGLVFLIAAPLYGAQWGLVAALLTAFSPHLVNIGVYVLSEALLITFLVGFAFATTRISLSPDSAAVSIGRPHTARPWLLVAIAGALLAAAALVHPTFEYMLIPWAILLAWSARGTARWRLPLAAILGFAVIFTPWLARNALSLGAAQNQTPIVNTIHHGIYPGFMFEDDPRTFGYPYRFDPRSPEISQDLATVFDEIQRRFETQPIKHINWYLFGKPLAMWSWDSVQGMGDTFIYEVTDTPYAHHPGFISSHRLMQVLHWPLVLLGAIGAILVWVPSLVRPLSAMQRLGLRTLSLLLLYATAIHMIGAPFPRYATPLRPLLFVMAITPFYLGLPFLRSGKSEDADPKQLP